MNRAAGEQPGLHPAQDEEDLRLVENVRQGDRISFDRLVLKYRDRIVMLCVRTLGDFQEGEDAAQETFVKAYRSIGGFRGRASFSTWLYRIAVNTCRNQGQSWWNRAWRTALHLDKPAVDGEGNEMQTELAGDDPPASAELDRKRTGEAIRAAIKKLPLIHRQLIVLRDIEGKSYEEIEGITGVPAGTVKSRLARARAALQNDLKGLLA
ncbi:MAG TPA: sigma-70 family RNA polymerase sigma factor [Chitinivibrionales bacterium]|nr:sigma-70 family RNA polymerase sigma factor [Chitinivibrionales bacterium]